MLNIILEQVQVLWNVCIYMYCSRNDMHFYTPYYNNVVRSFGPSGHLCLTVISWVDMTKYQ